MDNTIFDDDFYAPDFKELAGYIPEEKRTVALFPTLPENVSRSSQHLAAHHAPAVHTNERES